MPPDLPPCATSLASSSGTGIYIIHILGPSHPTTVSRRLPGFSNSINPHSSRSHISPPYLLLSDCSPGLQVVKRGPGRYITESCPVRHVCLSGLPGLDGPNYEQLSNANSSSWDISKRVYGRILSPAVRLVYTGNRLPCISTCRPSI